MSSYRKMNAFAVRDALNKLVQHRITVNTNRIEKLIAVEMQTKSYLFGLIKTKAKTREQAIEVLEDGDYISEYHFSKDRMLPTDRMKELLALCYTNDAFIDNVVYMTAEDVHLIEKYLKE